MAKRKPKPEHERDTQGKPKGKERGARGSGHFVTIHEPDGGTHAVFLKGPPTRGMSHAGKPRGLETRARDAAHRADFISGGQVTGWQKEHAKAVKESHRLRTAREAHNEGVKAKRLGAHVVRQVHGKQLGFRERVAATRATQENHAGAAHVERRVHATQSTFRERLAEAKAKRAPAKPSPPTHTAAAPYPASGRLGQYNALGPRRAAYGQHSAARAAEKASSLDRASAMLREQRAAAAPARVAASVKSRQGAFRERVKAAKAKATAPDQFTLRPPHYTKTFESTGKGKTKPLFEEMRGAAGRELPGQTNFLGARPDTRVQPMSTMRAAVESARLKGSATRDRKAQSLKAQRAKLAEARRDPSAHTEHAPGTVTELKTSLVHFDPERFQYKLAAQGQHGVTDALSGVKKYDPELGGVLQVWKDPANGKVFVVNGHHRLDLANKLGAGKVAVRFVQAKSAEEARATGAITNIAEGRGSSLDAAKFFRDTGLSREHLESRGVPMREKVATEGLALSNLHEPIFKRVVAGELTPARGAIIGSGTTHAQQKAILTGLERLPKGRQPSDTTLRNAVEGAKHAPTVTKKTAGLFGEDVDEFSLGLHRGEAEGAVRERLSREKKVFGTVARERNASDLERGGNVINAAESGKISQAAAENLATFDLLKHRSGPVSKLLNEAAERVHKGEKKKAVHDEIYRRLPAAVRDALAGG